MPARLKKSNRNSLSPAGKTPSNIETLRRRITTAARRRIPMAARSKTKIDTVAVIFTFSDLIAHPDAEWRDIFEGFRLSGYLREDAALRLYDLLKVPRGHLECNCDPLYWQEILKKEGLNLNDKLASWKYPRRVQ